MMSQKGKRYMAASVDEEKLKELFKSALVEVLEERGDLVRELFAEALEDVALARAIGEGMQSATVSREEVFASLSTSRLNEFFAFASESSLDKIWDNTEDDVYKELLED
jgi:hypothetical protein